MSYNLIPWSPDLDLSEFYKIAAYKGFLNNSSQKMLVDCFDNEREKQVWIFYYNGKPVGSVAAHSFDEMGKNCYRIAARTCLFSDQLPMNNLRTITGISTNQNYAAQFFIPRCIEWAPTGSRLYITSNENSAGTQKKVHRTFGPAMEKTGQMKRVSDIYYRGTIQTVWELYPDKFYEILNRYPRWN